VATLTATDVAERVATVRDRIERAGGDCEQITLVAVTKEHSWAPAAARAVGLHDLGENRIERILEHAAGDDDQRDTRWHLIGEIQRRKVRRDASLVYLWQTVDRLEEGDAVAEAAPGAKVLVQLNLSGEPQKQGCAPDDAPRLVDGLRERGLDVQGLMGMGPLGDPEAARPGFKQLVALADQLELPVRSIGMSDDLEVAVQEGSTMVRIGRALFGPRSEPRAARR
jgi:pyridoxal phosphate enzyme (YggS family)